MNPFNDPNLRQAMQFNPNFNPQNPNLGNLNGANLNNFQGLNPNPQPMAQNNQLCFLQLLAAQIQNNPQLQMNLWNQIQAQNLAAPFQQGVLPFMGHNWMPNPNQMMSMMNPQFLPQNQMLQGNQMMGLLGNPQLGPNNMSSGFGNASVSSGSGNNQWNMKNMQQANESQQFQVEAKKIDNSLLNSQNSSSRGSERKFQGHGKERSHNRFQKSEVRDMRSSKRNMKQFNRRGGRGQHNWGEHNPQSTNSGEEAPAVRRRPLPVNYTKTDIQLWREARKKNFPTIANINKKKANDSKNNMDEDAKLRRQQLKEILVKQAELGVEVAEIPPSYLREPEEKESKGNRFNKRRGRGQGQDNRHSKRQSFKKKRAPPTPLSVKREPNLLEKLLSADIKRDKARLLQVFRFMVLNDFFKQCPDKALEFPNITVKDEVFTQVSREKESSVAEKVENESDEEDANNATVEQFEDSEEGEIMD